MNFIFVVYKLFVGLELSYMHWDDTPITRMTEILVLAKLLKELVWTKTSRRIGASLFKKISSVPRGISSSFKKTVNRWTHFSVASLFLKKSESRRHSLFHIRPSELEAEANFAALALPYNLGHTPFLKNS